MSRSQLGRILVSAVSYTVEDMVREYGGLGEFEHLVILSVLYLEQYAYCRAVRDKIGVVTGHYPSVGAVHVTLARLERKGLISSRVEPPTGKPGGRSKRIYKLEAAGIEAVLRVRDVLRRFYLGLLHPGRHSCEMGLKFHRARQTEPMWANGCRYPVCLSEDLAAFKH